MSLEIKNKHQIRIVHDRDNPSIESSPEQGPLFSDAEETSIQQKYRLFFAGLKIVGEEMEELKLLLSHREKVLEGSPVGDGFSDADLLFETEQQQAMLACIDQDIAELLEEDAYSRFELFKESGLEHYQLKRFELTIGELCPLTQVQLERLLVAKLTRKNDFLAALADANQLAGERTNSARGSVEQAVRHYHANYLEDARAILDEQQWQHLNRFETREFEDIYLIELT